MNKTIYIKEEDAPLWERAREVSNDRLSPVIVEALRKFVVEKEAELKGVQRIVIEYNDSRAGGKPTAKAFQGRWLIAPDEEHQPSDRVPVSFAVADTPKGGVVMLEKFRGGKGQLHVYGSFEEALVRFPAEEEFDDEAGTSALHEAMRRRGVPVEELDV